MADDSIVAFLIGIGAGIIIHIYQYINDTYIEPLFPNRKYIPKIISIPIFGGVSGVFIYYTGIVFSSFIYGLGGILLVAIAIAISERV